MSGSISRERERTAARPPAMGCQAWYCLFLAAAFAVLPVRGDAAEEGILSTRHNLSVSGPGPIKAVSEPQVCIFCHTPHHASSTTPLWSRPEITTVYDIYSSSTRAARPGQPTGSSRLCLSCHDGTIAVGALYGSATVSENTIPLVGGFTRIPIDRPTNLGGTLGKDLTNDHPISFEYSSELVQKNGQITPPSLLPREIRLDKDNYLQCTTCHNPHKNPYGKFLVMDNAGSALCVTCHSVTNWAFSGHATNAATAATGCGNCHLPHNARTAERLMKERPEEQNCLPCHSSGGSGKDIEITLTYAYIHPVSDKYGVHDTAESPLTADSHVECEDCHNPHQARNLAATAPDVNGSLAGVTGVGLSGEVKEAAFEYEVCFKCHGDNNFYMKPPVVRKIHDLNARLEFADNNPSFHPVAATNTGVTVPSLREGYSTESFIYCTDCHGSDLSARAGGNGANGPHGSGVKYMLLHDYETDRYPLAYNDSNYALCYRCHDQTKLFSALSPFYKASANLPLHDHHVRTQSIPCYVCHDPHGISRFRGGTDSGNAHLINFVDTSFIGAGASYDADNRSCTVSCHSVNPRTY